MKDEPAPRKADRVAEDLLAQIVSGGHSVGSLLPREAELAAHYEVNRSVIREAVKLLEVHRLVHPVRRRGTEVLDPYASLSPAVLRHMLAPRPGQIDRGALADLLEVRAALDEQMCTLAAERRDDADLALMDAKLDALGRALPDPRRFFPLVDDLSIAIARATHNRVFQMLIHWNRLVVSDLMDVFRTTRPNAEGYVRGLALLVDLIRRREAEEARLLVRAYHAWAKPRLLTAAALASGEPLERVMEEPR